MQGTQRPAALRLLVIHQLFTRDHWQGSTRQLAEKLGVSRKTVLGDLDALRGEPFYLPIVQERVWQLDKVTEQN